MAARRTPACLDLARRKLRFRGVCTAASRKNGTSGRDSTGLGGDVPYLEAFFILRFERLKIENCENYYGRTRRILDDIEGA